MYKFVLKAEGDVGGGLNDGLNELCDVFIFDGDQMITANGLLELRCSDSIAHEGLACVYIDFSAVNGEANQIVKAQMRNGADEIVHIV